MTYTAVSKVFFIDRDLPNLNKNYTTGVSSCILFLFFYNNKIF